MALSPWHLARTLEDYEAAALLAGYSDLNPEAESWAGIDEALLNQWITRMIAAAHQHELAIVDIQASTIDPLSPDYQRLRDCPFGRFVSMEEMINEKLRRVIFKVERGELYRWLKASGIPDDDIPEALRVIPSGRKGSEMELNPRREDTYLRIIAALLAMQYSANEMKEPYPLAEQVLDDCQTQAIKAPASRNTLGGLFKQLPPVQVAPQD